MTSIDPDHLKSWIGREERAHETLTPGLVARFGATFDQPVDTEPGAAAPGLIHWCLCQPAAPQTALGPDGHPARGGFLPPVPLPRRMWAGGAVTLESPLPVGAIVGRRSTVTDVALKTGRSGPLCFVTVVHEFSADGAVRVRERQDIVYREAPTAATAIAGSEAASPPGGTALTLSPTLLFRYSALTFNGHRIHYDRDYAQTVEGYAGLVVHGPLLAQLLMLMAEEELGPLSSFSFRATSALMDFEMATLCRKGRQMWVRGPDGRQNMQAEVTALE